MFLKVEEIMCRPLSISSFPPLYICTLSPDPDRRVKNWHQPKGYCKYWSIAWSPVVLLGTLLDLSNAHFGLLSEIPIYPPSASSEFFYDPTAFVSLPACSKRLLSPILLAVHL
eukprot:g12525.t1